MEKRFSDLAILVCGVDNYSFLWDAWYWYFWKNWNLDLCNAYFLNEKKDVNFPGMKQIKVNITDFDLWTKKIREALKQIPENDIFFFMADHFFIDKFKHNEFEHIYEMYQLLDADALRIRPITRKNLIERTPYYVGNVNIKKFTNDSMYLISNGFNIIRKSFFLKCLKVDENARDNEIKGTERIRSSKPDIYNYEKFGWIVDVCRQGAVIPEGQLLIDNYKNYELERK